MNIDELWEASGEEYGGAQNNRWELHHPSEGGKDKPVTTSFTHLTSKVEHTYLGFA